MMYSWASFATNWLFAFNGERHESRASEPHREDAGAPWCIHHDRWGPGRGPNWLRRYAIVWARGVDLVHDGDHELLAPGAFNARHADVALDAGTATGASGLSLAEFTFASYPLMRFVGTLDAIFRLTAAWKLFDHLVDTTRHISTDRWPDSNNVSDFEFMRRHRFRVGWLGRDAVNLEAPDYSELAATFPNVV